jgi:hypothetical protein
MQAGNENSDAAPAGDSVPSGKFLSMDSSENFIRSNWKRRELVFANGLICAQPYTI